MIHNLLKYLKDELRWMVDTDNPGEVTQFAHDIVTKTHQFLPNTVDLGASYSSRVPYSEFLTVRKILLYAQTIKYKYSKFQFYSSFVTKGSLCFDIGANIGDYTATYLALGANVIALEPNIFLIPMLRRRFKGNRHLTVIPKGVAKFAGTTDFFLCTNPSTSSMSRPWTDAVAWRLPDSNWFKSVKVPVTTLDELINEYGVPHFCKIDVEGYEYDVVQGLSHPIAFISFEYTTELLEPAIKCIAHLSSLGAYSYNYSSDPTVKLALSKWVPGKKISDMLHERPFGKTGDVYAKLI